MKHNSLIIVGSGGHASVVYEAAKKMKNWDQILILDESKDGVILGVDELYSNRIHYKETHDIFVAIGNNHIREVYMNELQMEDFSFATIIHPSAVIADSVLIEKGSCLLAGSIINPFVKIARGVIINTGVQLDHHSCIGEFTHVCPGTILAGHVTVGNQCFLGVGSVVSNQVQITNEVTLGAGCVVLKTLRRSGTYVGIPARLLVDD